MRSFVSAILAAPGPNAVPQQSPHMMRELALYVTKLEKLVSDGSMSSFSFPPSSVSSPAMSSYGSFADSMPSTSMNTVPRYRGYSSNDQVFNTIQAQVQTQPGFETSFRPEYWQQSPVRPPSTVCPQNLHIGVGEYQYTAWNTQFSR